MSKSMRVFLAALMLLLGLMVLVRVTYGIEPPATFSVSEPSVWRRYTWSASAVPGAAEYCLYRDDKLWTYSGGCLTSPTLGYFDKMMPGETYKWAVTARDPNGEESAQTVVYFTASEASAAPNIGAVQVNAVFVLFPDWTDEPFTIPWAQSVLDDWAARWTAHSYGLQTITSQAEGWLMMPQPHSFYCDEQDETSGLWKKCDRLAIRNTAKGLMQNPTPFSWVVPVGVVVSGNGEWVGATSVNGFLNAGVVVLGHEWGHHKGGLHSGYITSALDENPYNITINAAGDDYDWMGLADPNTARVSSMNRYLWGWIPVEDTLEVTSSQEVWLYDIEQTSGTRLVYIPVGTDPPTQAWNYNFEYRQDLGKVIPRLHVGHTGGDWRESGIMDVTEFLSLGGPEFDVPGGQVHVEVVADEGHRVQLEITIQGGGGGGLPPPVQN